MYNHLDLAMYRDRNGRWTRNFYNASQLVAVEDALGRLTKFDWCGCGSLENIIDPLGRVPGLETGAWSCLVLVKDPDSDRGCY